MLRGASPSLSLLANFKLPIPDISSFKELLLQGSIMTDIRNPSGAFCVVARFT